MRELPQPTQPLLVDPAGRVRFKANAIVRAFLDRDTERHRKDLGGAVPASFGGLNWAATQNFPQEDWEQFYQLIGYSLTGYNELSLVSDASCEAANQLAHAQFGAHGGCRANGCPIHIGVEET